MKMAHKTKHRDRNEKLEGEKEDALIHSKWRNGSGVLRGVD